MAKVHDLFIVELAEVIKGYGNDPDDKDPFRLSEFYRFYELPNIAVSRENFEKMRPVEPKQKKGKWMYGENEFGNDGYYCSVCGNFVPWKYGEYDIDFIQEFLFCNKCGADMRGEQDK